MKSFFKALTVAAASSLLVLPALSQTASPQADSRGGSPSPVHATGASTVPGTSTTNPFRSFDVIYVDPLLQLGALASRSSKAITLFNAYTGQPFGKTPAVFAGVGRTDDLSGPNGLVVAGLQLWATDYPSLVRVFDLLPDPAHPSQVATIDTGGAMRADGIDYDWRNRTIIVGNGDTNPSFVTLISTSTRQVTHRITFDGTKGTPDASIGGIGGVLYNSSINAFLVSLTQIGTDPTKSAVAVLNPSTGAVTRVISGFNDCEAATMAQGPNDNVILACDPGFPAPDPVVFAPRTYIFNARTGAIVANITQTGGADEVAYNAGDRRYYTASRDYFTSPSATTATPVLGVIDAVTNKFIENVPTGTNSHSVAANLLNNSIYVPLVDPNPLCNGLPGCVGIFTSNRSHGK